MSQWLRVLPMVLSVTLMSGCLQSEEAAASKPATAAAAPPASVAAAVRERIQAFAPDAVIVAVRDTPVDGLVEVEVEGGVLYASRDGRYLLRGDLSRLEGQQLVSLTEQTMARKRVALLQAQSTRDMIVFPARGKAKAVVTVFTDTDCGYCRRLHEQVPDMNRRGIEVRYLAFPRSLPRTGMASGTAKVMQDVWCHPKPDQALTTVKAGGRVAPAKAACQSPVAAQYQLGQQMGVRGTPAIYDSQGEALGGYMTAADLAARLGLK